MKDFGKVSSRFWVSDDIQPMSDRAKLMALYLLTNRHGNLIGIFKLTRGYMADDLCWDRLAVQEALDELVSNHFLTLSERGDYLCINRFMDHNPTVNQKQIVARLRVLKKLPDNLSMMLPEAVPVVQRVLDKLSGGKASREVKQMAEQVRRLLETRSEDVSPEKYRNIEVENIEKEYVRSGDWTQSPATKPSTKTADLSDEFEQWWLAYPKREGDKGHKKRTFSKYQKLIREQGVTPEQLLANLHAYARYCDETDATGTCYVKTTEPYLNNPDNLTNPWMVNHAARQRTTGRPDPLDQFLEANAEHYRQPEESRVYNPEADSGSVWDHDRPVRGEVDEGARTGGSDGTVA